MLDKYRKLSVISGILVRILYLLMASPQRRINIELLLGISATFLSLAALVVSIFQTKIAREQQQASVWPHLQAAYTKTNGEFDWSIVNNGIGPAIIKSVTIHYQGKAYKNAYALINEQIQRAIRKMPPNKTAHLGVSYGDMDGGDVIKSDGELRLGQITQNDLIAELMLEVIRDPSYRFTVTYNDVYSNCWQLDQDKITALGKCAE